MYLKTIIVANSSFIIYRFVHKHNVNKENELFDDYVKNWNSVVANIVKEKDYMDKKLIAYNLNEEIHYVNQNLYNENKTLFYSKTNTIKKFLKDILIH